MNRSIRQNISQAVVTTVGVFVVLVLCLAIFRIPVIESLKLLFEGSLGDKYGIGRTFKAFSPALLTALSVIVAWKAGMFNIGGEGQYVVGGVCAAFACRPFILDGVADRQPAIVTLLALVAAGLGGGIYGLFAGWLKVKRGVDVVISTILLNFIAIDFLKYAVNYPLKEKVGGLPLSDQLPMAAMLYRPDRQTDLNAGFVVALVAALLVWVFLRRTRTGFLVSFVGTNPLAARASRLPSDRIQLLAMFISGLLAGLGGAITYLGVTGQVGTDFSQNWGFYGIPVALLAALSPLGSIISAFLFGALFAGSQTLGRFVQHGDTILFAVQGLAVLAAVASQSELLKSRRKPKLSEGTE